MDLKLFHHNPDMNFYVKDRANGATSRFWCGVLEWSPWYNGDNSQRLLGHYRLFQIYKKNRLKTPMQIPLVQAYILQYQSTHPIKYFISRLIGFLCTRLSKDPYYPVETEGMNKILISDRSDVLAEFLTHADEDFEAAIYTASRKIESPDFYTTRAPKTTILAHTEVIIPTTTVNTITNVHTTNAAPAKELKGKEPGVLSKKQIMILFDLLGGSECFERLDFHKPNKHAAIAELFHALTGKPKSSFMEALKDYQHHSLYKFDTEGQRNELKGILTNLGQTFRNAGMIRIADLADKKIRELEATKRE